MNANAAWLLQLQKVLEGRDVSPRGKPTKELPQSKMEVDMMGPVVTAPGRKLSYQFMGAEAYWILSGDDRVETIAPYNKRISEFSDDGVRFFGAYGPKVVAQLPYIVDKLLEDSDSRQAGLTIWRESPPKTKDVPCTVAMFFALRQKRQGVLGLNSHVFMRSNDVWLGTPYDVFNFSAIAWHVCGKLNKIDRDSDEDRSPSGAPIEPGTLYLTAASSHLYKEHWEQARAMLESEGIDGQTAAPPALWQDTEALMSTLKALRDSKSGDAIRWWKESGE